MSSKTFLSLAADLRLPLTSVSRTFGLLAGRGAGKSNTAAVMAEEMFGAKLPFVVIDPVGAWYGLRSSADGSKPGLPIPIFGGKHGDVPSTATSFNLTGGTGARHVARLINVGAVVTAGIGRVAASATLFPASLR